MTINQATAGARVGHVHLKVSILERAVTFYREALATIVHRVLQAGIELDGASDHGVSEAIYLRDPDEVVKISPFRPSGLSVEQSAVIEAGLRTLGKAPSVRYHPYIAARWMEQIRVTYQSIWEYGEIPLIGYDDTLMGSASEGWIASSQRLYWKAVLNDPQCLKWCDIVPQSASLASTGLRIGKHVIPAYVSELRQPMVDFVRALAGGTTPL